MTKRNCYVIKAVYVCIGLISFLHTDQAGAVYWTNERMGLVFKGAIQMSEVKSELLKLAEEKIGQLSKAEERLFIAVANGEIADYSDTKKENNDPNNAGKWDNERVIRSKCVEWLCTDKEAQELVTHKGILVKGVRIDEELVLMFAKIPFPLVIMECAILSGIDLRHAEIQMLGLKGTHTGRIRADSLKVKGDIILRDGFKAEGEVRLVGAEIGGQLACKNGQFINPNECAINADFLKVEGSVILSDGFKAEGEVRLLSATIRQKLDCNNGQFINPNGYALNADALKVEGSILLRNGFKAKGKVDLRGAKIGGQVSCKNGEFINPKGMAINADSIKVETSVLLNEGFKAEGEVRLAGAEIGGQLGCNNGQFNNPDGDAIIADELIVASNVFFCEGFKAQGKVRLHGTTIGGDLNCDGGQFINPKGEAIDGDSLTVENNVFMHNGFRAEGEVYLVGAKIGGQLACTGGQFINPDGKALNADSIKVDKHVFLSNNFKAEGKIDFVGAEIGGIFQWLKVDSPEKVILDLRSAQIGTLYDETKSWPNKGKLLLNGLTYSEIFDKSPKDYKTRIEWIRKQYDTEKKKDFQFRPQPYEQLAVVLKKSGNENDAKKVLIAKNKDKVRLTQLTWSKMPWYRVFGPMIGFGYRPWRAFWIGIVIVLLGWLVFWAGYRAEVMTHAKEGAEASGGFCALAYSLDVFVPLVDLRQASYCMPNANLTGEFSVSDKLKLTVSGKYLRYYLWFEVIAGWTLTTLLVVGLTGLVRT